MRLLLFNLATDTDDPILGFTTCWIQALAKRVEFVHVITMRAGRVEVPGNVRVYSIGKEKGYSEPRRAVEFYRYLFRVLREDRIDVCFSHMIPIFSVLAAPILKARGIPIVTWYAHPSLTWVLKLAHHLSDKMVASLATAYPYRHDKLVVVGQGIDTDLFCPEQQVALDDPPMILCVGRLSPVKDHLTLLRAARILRERWGKPFQVVILGGPARPQDKAYTQSLRAQVKELGLDDIVRFEPPIPMVNLADWYRRCTVYVNLTPTGSGDKVAWEAMACGKPCVAANEGFRETMGWLAGRLLFRHGDADDLATSLSPLLQGTREWLADIGAELRRGLLKLHSLDGFVERLVDLFVRLKTKR